jgi:FkbM family methyltransferase
MAVNSLTPILLQMKSAIVGTPVERLGLMLRWGLNARQRYKHPELWSLYLEERCGEAILRKVMKANSCAVDVGAHIGSVTNLLRTIAPQGHHIAIEPSSRKASWLTRKFPDVEVHCVAASDQDGVAYFDGDLEYWRCGRLSSATTSHEVQTRRLDTIICDRRVDLIKVDVEGFELNVLRGATLTISKHQPTLLFECGSEYELLERDISRRALYDFLTDEVGYSIQSYADFLFGKGPMQFDEFRRCGLYPFRAFNFVALPYATALSPAG